MSRPAVFLDRDGTLTREVNYLRNVRQLRLLPGTAGAVRALNEAGLAVVLLTNQSGIARGLLSEETYLRIHAALAARLARQGARLDGHYYCPHHPEARVARYRKDCACRKPAPGMLQRAAGELDLDLRRSYAIGDRSRDLAPGHTLGATTVLVLTGYGKEERSQWRERWEPDRVAPNLAAAAAWIVERN